MEQNRRCVHFLPRILNSLLKTWSIYITHNAAWSQTVQSDVQQGWVQFVDLFEKFGIIAVAILFFLDMLGC